MILDDEASRGAQAQAHDCKRDRLWVHCLLKEVKHLLSPMTRPRAVLSSDLQHAEHVLQNLRKVQNGKVLMGFTRFPDGDLGTL